MSQRLSLAVALFAAAALASATTYTVTSTADSGAGSLRQAHPGRQRQPRRRHRSRSTSWAPASTRSRRRPLLPTRRRRSRSTATRSRGPAPTRIRRTRVSNSVLRIEIDCTNAGTYCLVIGRRRHASRPRHQPRIGGVATDFFQLVQNPVVEGCYFGTSADGLTSLTLPAGLTFGQHQNGRIGGTTPAARTSSPVPAPAPSCR